jgi:hypothetical protein
MANLDRVKAGIHSFEMPYQYNANGPAHGGWVAQGITKAESLEPAMSRVKGLVAYLASQFHRRGDLAGAARCAILLRHLFKEDTSGATHVPSLHGAINKLVNGPKPYLFSGVDALNVMIDQRLTSGSREESSSGGTVKYSVRNPAVRRYLRQLLPGRWQKVIKQGNSGAVHYFEHVSGQVAGVKYYPH